MEMDREWRHHAEVAPHCPRCGSTNTKFCYYNNYSLTQPRYFCKGCRRYWTKGGSLRNVPMGGGCRKHRRGRVAGALRISGGGSEGGVVPSRSIPKIGSTEYQLGAEQCSGSSRIDLATVYANFVNRRPENGDDSNCAGAGAVAVAGAGVELPELPNEFEIPEFFGLHLPKDHQNGMVGCIQGTLEMSNLSNNDRMYYNCEGSNGGDRGGGGGYGGGMLAPLPGDEILWSNSHVLNQTISHEPVLGHDPSLLLGNWSPNFDLSSDDTFSRSI